MCCAEAQEDENREAARPPTRCGARKIDGMQVLTEAIQRGIGCFVSGFESGLGDLLARDSRVRYPAPVILGPEGAAQPNRVAHTLLPSMPVGICIPRATPPTPSHVAH
jgi:hypothetical protein